VDLIKKPHITSSDILHRRCNCADRRWGDKQVDMVGHQDIGMNRAGVTPGSLPQTLEIQAAVAVGEKARATVVPSLDDVQRDPGQL
jgi:hypothetical protein